MGVPIVVFDFVQSFGLEKGLMKGAQYFLNFVTSYFREFVFDPETFDDGVRHFFYHYDVNKFHFMKFKKATGEILNWSWAFGSWKQILRAQKLLANHQHLPRFMMHLLVHLKTNQLMFWAVGALRLHPWKVFCNKETKNRSRLWKQNQTYSFADFVRCAYDLHFSEASLQMSTTLLFNSHII